MAEDKVDGKPKAEGKSNAATADAGGKPNGKAALSVSTEIEPLQEVHLNSEDPTLWTGEGKGGKVARNKPDDPTEGGLSFEAGDEELFKYKPELPKLGRDLSFNHREELDGTTQKLARFSLNIGVSTANEDVQWVKVTSEEGRVYYDKVTKTIVLPAGQRPQWRTTHVLVAGLVKSLANDDLIRLTGFSCAAKGRVCLRDLRVGLASPTESAVVASSQTDGKTRAVSTVPLTQTPRYLVPQMEGVPVSEPAIYRSLYIVDTIDQDGPSLQIDTEKPVMWLAQPGTKCQVSQEDHSVFGSLARFHFYDKEPITGRFQLNLVGSNLPKGDEVSFEHLEKPDVTFTFEIAVSTSKASVTKIRVTSDTGNNSYDQKTGTVTVPVGKGADDLRTTRVPVAYLVESLAHDTLTGLGQFECLLTSPEELRFRKLWIRTAGPDSLEKLDKKLDQPLDPFSLTDDQLAKTQTKPAVGVFTVHSQGWVQKGLALGNLVQSMCLAPGEVTQVAVTDWRRKTKGTSVTSTTQSEEVSSQIEQDRAVNEVQNAVAREAQYGGSSAFGASASAQAGISMSTLFASGSASASSTVSSALTAQFSVGNRNLSASSSNALTQRTAEKSQALRSRRQAVVQEVSEQESETVSVRVLANYNRRHTLNIEFFEVLQLYQIETKLVGWERCLFVPLAPLDFSNADVIKRHRTQLINIFKELGAEGLLARMAKLNDDGTEDKTKAAAEQQTEIGTRIAKLAQAAAQIPAFHLFSAMLRANPSAANFQSGLNLALGAYHDIAKELSLTLPAVDNPDAMKIINGLIEKEQKRMALVAVSLGDVLNADRMFLSQQIWLRTNPYRFYCMLQGYKVHGQPVSMLIDPRPVGVFGNYLAFRWGFPRSESGKDAHDQFERTYLKQDDTTSPGAGTVVALPTSGVFAEGVLGRGEAAEVKDEFHYGRWDDDVIPILPPKIAKVTSRDRAKGVDLKGGDFASSLAALRAEKLENISNIDKILGQVSKGDMFRNMGGLEQALSLAGKLAEQSSAGATRAGDRAAEMQAKMFDTLVKVLDSEVGQAAIKEFVLPGSGLASIGLGDGAGKGAGKGAGWFMPADKDE